MPHPPDFDPEFDDTAWTDAWQHVRLALVPPGVHPTGYRVVRRMLREADILGRRYRFEQPFDCRLLYDPQGRLWMSNTPQELLMMYNNARRTFGRVLVGGLGLGLFPQFAVVVGEDRVAGFQVIERSPAVQAITEPLLHKVLPVPLEVSLGDIAEYLAGPPGYRFDTIFLDTWDTLDAAQLPAINRLRDHARRHLTRGGRVLLWGYRWMVRLFEDACRQVLAVSPVDREAWLAARGEDSPQALPLLSPVLEHFKGIEVRDMDAALAWCRGHIVNTAAPG